MRLRFRHHDTETFVYLGWRSVQFVQNDVDALRKRCGVELDLSTSLQLFLFDAHKWDTFPIIVLLRKRGESYGAVLFHGRKVWGIPTGVLKSGHLCGRGAVIAEPAQRPLVVQVTAQILLGRWLAHTLIVRLPQSDLLAGIRLQVLLKGGEIQWVERDARSVLSLEGGLDGAMSRLSYKLRRNLRYYRRRAQRRLQCVFIPDLTSEQAKDAVRTINSGSDHPLSPASALQCEAELRAMGSSVAMGLRDGAGNWLSFLAGWRQGDALYVAWQLNAVANGAASLSTVMRSYCLEHEAERGTRQIIFVGGTTPAWSRACLPEVRTDLLISSKGLIGFAARLLSRRLHPWGELADLHEVASGRKGSRTDGSFASGL